MLIFLPVFSSFFPFFHFHPVFMLLSLLLYFLPSVLARDKSSFTAIFLLNLFAGWTFIGWIAALIWAATAEQKQQVSFAPQRPAASTSLPASAGFFCSACGKRSTSGGRFCSACGASLVPAHR